MLATRPGLAAALPIALALAVLVGCAPDPPPLQGRTGDTDGVDLAGGAPGLRIEYGSIDVRGEPAAVTALVGLPAGDPPPEGWPVVAYAHATTGVADECAPSREPALAGTGAAVAALAAAGYVAVATDYEGLGTRGPHPYLHGPSEAQAIVDSVRAVRSLVPAASTRWAVTGYSQGGHAALWTAQLAADLAPELELIGAAAVAPVTDPAELAGVGTAFFALTVAGWLAVDPGAEDAAGALLSDAGDEALEELEDRCTTDAAGEPRVPGASAEALDAFLHANRVGDRGAEVPVLIAGGDDDELVPPATLEAAARRLCDLGSTVEVVRVRRADHGTIVDASRDEVDRFLAERFAGRPARSTC